MKQLIGVILVAISTLSGCELNNQSDEKVVIKDSLSTISTVEKDSSDTTSSAALQQNGTHTHIFLNYSGSNAEILQSVNKANEIFNNPNFYSQIAQTKSFDSTSFTPAELSELLKNTKIDIRIATYYWVNPIHPKRCVNANTPSSEVIKLNTRCFGGTLAEAVNTLVHEAVHAVDRIDGKLDFTHWSNDNSDGSQDNTAPWVIGAIAEEMVTKGK